MAHFDAEDAVLDVLYVDDEYDYALVYECQKTQEDGTCVPGEAVIIALRSVKYLCTLNVMIAEENM